MGSWSEIFQNPNIKNRGISGDVTEGILYRINEITESQPLQVFLMIGTNDAMASFDNDSGKRYKRNNKLPEVPTFKSYQKLLLEFLRRT